MIVLAPLAGGPSTPELAAAVSNAGGLGFLGLAYLTADQAADQLRATRELTDRPFGANLFVPGPPSDPAAYEPYVERLKAWAQERALDLGEPRHDDDDFAAKLDLLAADPPAVVSFTFGCPPPGTKERLNEMWITVTTPDEAEHAEAAGADALVVQGTEAGGHRGAFHDTPGAHEHGLLELLRRIDSPLPKVAAGGIATPEHVEAVLDAGATHAQVGTAFMLCPEAGTSPAHREAIRSETPTRLTRAFTGRLARGIVNEFLTAHDAAAPVAYPEIHHVTAPLRRAARERGETGLINLWAGEAHALAREEPAAEVVRRLSAGRPPG